MLEIKNLHAAFQNTAILRGVSLSVEPGSLHAIMGPNGSGKSTFASVLAGHPFFTVTDPQKHKTSLSLDETDLLEASPDERSRAGLFLAFQYPVEVPGVSVQNFLRQAHKARFVTEPDKQFSRALDFFTYLKETAGEFGIDESFLTRGLNEGFSGGEKKQLEILQMAVLAPRYAILDETDSGLDMDAIKKVSANIQKIRAKTGMGCIMITHYNRILEYVSPSAIHVMVGGAIVRSGGPELIQILETEGYAPYKQMIEESPA